ncbi:MAG TPA: histidine phosphatase family protein [Roseiflexaceae bacterium]|nr:histidine phosphatase family protein [Roseiflexaceae bacterium]
MTTHLYLIRHGEAYTNVEAVIGGMRGDRGLTERGAAQAEALERRLAGGEIAADVLYASTLPRARQTAEHVARALQLPIEWDDELHELRPGEADGMRVEDARAKFAGFNAFLREPFTPIAPGGESWGSFQARTSAALERIITKHQGQTIVVVAHGGTIEVSFLYMLGLGPHARARNAFHGQNTAITHWRHVESFGRQEWHLVTHNDHRHLIVEATG